MSLTSYRAAPPRVGRERGCGPGGDLLFRRLSGSTIGAEGFHGRVRDGIGCLAPRYDHQAGQGPHWVRPLWVGGRVVRRSVIALPRGVQDLHPTSKEGILALGAAVLS